MVAVAVKSALHRHRVGGGCNRVGRFSCQSSLHRHRVGGGCNRVVAVAVNRLSTDTGSVEDVIAWVALAVNRLSTDTGSVEDVIAWSL